MHSNVRKMLSAIGYAVSFGNGAFAILGNPIAALRSRLPRPAVQRIQDRNHLIHLIIN